MIYDFLKSAVASQYLSNQKNVRDRVVLFIKRVTVSRHESHQIQSHNVMLKRQ